MMQNRIDAEYLVDTKSRKERMKHCDLSTECIVETTKKREYPNVYRNALAEYTKTTLPSGNEYHACHACNNGKCKNPKHIYWGTPKENQEDLLSYYNQLIPEKVGKLANRREIMKAITLMEFDDKVKRGQIQIMHDMSENQIEYQDHAVICETITVEKPKGKNTFHALYKLKRKRHRLAKLRDFKTNLRETDSFHIACVYAIIMHYANHWKYERGMVPSELAEKWVRMWNSGKLKTKEDLYAVYDEWMPNNIMKI